MITCSIFYISPYNIYINRQSPQYIWNCKNGKKEMLDKYSTALKCWWNLFLSQIKTLMRGKVNCDLTFSTEKLKETSNKLWVSVLIQTKQRHNENPISQKLYWVLFCNSCWVSNLSRNFRSSAKTDAIYIFHSFGI